MKFLRFSHRWTLDQSTLNEPVAMADVVDPSAAIKDKVELQVEPGPGVYYA